ncbi:TetR family transcriptional regulator C-terminal domain-containing protein [Caballeronia sp. M23-90]
MPRPPNPEVRSRLLSIGRAVVHEHGFNNSGVQEITQAAGVPKGSFYNYFDSKESFAAEILEDYWQAIELRHGPILYDARLKPLLRIERFFASLTQDHREHGFVLGCLIGNLSLELASDSDDTRGKLADVIGRWEGALATCLREAQERRELHSEMDSRQLAAIIIEAYEGSVMRAKVERSGKALERFGKVVLPLLLH